MERLTFYERGQEILEHLDRNEDETALKKAVRLLNSNPENALVWFILGLCHYQKQDIFNAIDSFTHVLRYDPDFISAAEMLLKLNKDNYSVGELKYIYSLILAHKEGTREMYQYLQKFSDVTPVADLTIPNIGQDELKAETLPGSDDNAYIQHLINEMDKPAPEEEISQPAPKKEISIIPESAYTPPKKQAPSLVPNANKIGPQTHYGIETMTMATLYIRQGLYDQALGILLKLQQRDPGSQRIKEEIDRVNILMKEAKKE